MPKTIISDTSCFINLNNIGELEARLVDAVVIAL